jgi:hypothetical protein
VLFEADPPPEHAGTKAMRTARLKREALTARDPMPVTARGGTV